METPKQTIERLRVQNEKLGRALDPRSLEVIADEIDAPGLGVVRAKSLRDLAAFQRAAMGKESRHPIVEVDPRDACLDEIAELLRGEVGADEIAEISRIVESSGRRIA